MNKTEYHFLNATGKLPYNMTNDYMFRMVLQKDKETLLNLISSLLHIDKNDIYDVRIDNSVEPGKSMREKEYDSVMPVYHIGFLDFTLFNDHPEFFSIYQMRNSKDNHLYTDKFNLYVIELNHTDIASNEDKKYHIDTWAKLFKARTWEEIKMITNDNPSMNSTAEAIYVSNSNEQILEECWLREERIAHENHQKELIQSLTDENAKLRKLLKEHGIEA